MTLPSVQNKTVSASEKNLSKVISVFGFEHAGTKRSWRTGPSDSNNEFLTFLAINDLCHISP